MLKHPACLITPSTTEPLTLKPLNWNSRGEISLLINWQQRMKAGSTVSLHKLQSAKWGTGDGDEVPKRERKRQKTDTWKRCRNTVTCLSFTPGDRVPCCSFYPEEIFLLKKSMWGEGSMSGSWYYFFVEPLSIPQLSPHPLNFMHLHWLLFSRLLTATTYELGFHRNDSVKKAVLLLLSEVRSTLVM